MKGMATGIVGVVAQPVKGVADMISDVGKGIDSSTARLHGFKSVERLRAVPPPSRWLTLPYNHNSAVASTFLRQWQGATCSRPLVAAVLDLTGHSDWRCSVMVFHCPRLRNQPGEHTQCCISCMPAVVSAATGKGGVAASALTCAASFIRALHLQCIPFLGDLMLKLLACIQNDPAKARRSGSGSSSSDDENAAAPASACG